NLPPLFSHDHRHTGHSPCNNGKRSPGAGRAHVVLSASFPHALPRALVCAGTRRRSGRRLPASCLRVRRPRHVPNVCGPIRRRTARTRKEGSVDGAFRSASNLSETIPIPNTGNAWLRKFAAMRARSLWPFILLALACIALFLAHLSIGSVDVPLRDVIGSFFITGDRSEFHMIVREVRLPQAITALLAGCGLAASGLMMQTLFRNPLAGPSVLGISSGASLGVALIMLARPLWVRIALPADAAVIAAALIGSIGVLLLILLADKRVGDGITLLIIGL